MEVLIIFSLSSTYVLLLKLIQKKVISSQDLNQILQWKLHIICYCMDAKLQEAIRLYGKIFNDII